ncbi:unnamed protein product, partial [Rotaria magnacalcarata]
SREECRRIWQMKEEAQNSTSTFFPYFQLNLKTILDFDDNNDCEVDA